MLTNSSPLWFLWSFFSTAFVARSRQMIRSLLWCFYEERLRCFCYFRCCFCFPPSRFPRRTFERLRERGCLHPCGLIAATAVVALYVRCYFFAVCCRRFHGHTREFFFYLRVSFLGQTHVIFSGSARIGFRFFRVGERCCFFDFYLFVIRFCFKSVFFSSNLDNVLTGVWKSKNWIRIPRQKNRNNLVDETSDCTTGFWFSFHCSNHRYTRALL